jgi:hypothetical protein
MAIRIKSKWFKKDNDRPTESMLKENAQALAFIAWRLALDKAKNLHGEDFIYDNDQQRVYVIAEYLALFIQVADRHVYERLDDQDRAAFITQLAQRLSDHMQDNCVDLFGEGDYRENFIKMLNNRSAGYAEFDYSQESGPSYSFMHYFGTHVQKVMGDEHHSNKWVIDQAMELDGPEVIEKFIKALDDLFI